MYKNFERIKKMMLLLAFALCFVQLSAQQNNIIPPPLHIKTVTFKPLDPVLYAPMVKLGEKLRLSFDDIDAEQNIYSYKI